MAVNIADLQVETQAPAAQSSGTPKAGGATGQPQPDMRAELEKQRERQLRLRAD